LQRTTLTRAAWGGAAIAGILVAACCAVLVMGGTAGASRIDSLQAKVEAGKDEAAAIAEGLRATQEELASARERAAAAGARAERLSALLAEGQRKAARLAARVEGTQARLERQRRRLVRARRALARRLVAMYESGTPSEASLLLGSSDFDEMTTRGEYLSRIQEFDTALAHRVEEVRDSIRGTLRRVAELKRRADAYDARLAAARSQIAGVRAEAETAAGELRSLAASRSASLAELKSKIGGWVEDIEKAEAASRAAAEEEVGRWLGGPFSIPAYIVMCESGGDYGAVNPSSGAGGAYQILPSTWSLYGGEGAPQDASKAEQDRIAAEIWADSGPGAWACAS
jgi:septal ring factor EnvC (AmiA/AmiB activator)